MKIISTITMLFLVATTYGQIQIDSLKGVKISEHKLYNESDTIPKVFYVTKDETPVKPDLYINGKIIDQQVIKTIKPNAISEMEIRKESKGTNTNGEIHIKTKDNYLPKFISLNELKVKYVEKLIGPTLFILNEETINSDYDNCLVDEKFILKILVEKIDIEKEGLNLNLIRIITRTKENLKKANTLRLRG